MASKPNVLLGVNIDHVATLRQARGTNYPDPVHAAAIAEQAGADGITIHLREDRRHIVDRDVLVLNDTLQTRMNLEMAITEEMIALAEKIKPAHCCLVPEKREELTTEGGLDVIGNEQEIAKAVARLNAAGVEVSLFIDPDEEQLKASKRVGAPVVELHTGCYADAETHQQQEDELKRIITAVQQGLDLGLVINAGHGLHYHNVKPIAAIPGINELNIGHSIIARAVLSGLDAAVRDMKQLIQEAIA
jgi:pyridoxine 5-phosphate synthase